jgi:hypothetical protein
MLALGEIVVRLFSPTEYLAPRYRFSPAYGMMLFDNVVMEHGVPRKYKFHYTINEFACRGEPFAPSVGDSLPVVVVLGDSYSFGMGVNDGEEYPAVMNGLLHGRAAVVNLSCPGWALTQEIRRYYDFGVRYRPQVVVLQFCSNDAEANFTNRVTIVRDGELVFRDSAYGANYLKKFLSRSFLQYSQLYNFCRGAATRMVTQRFVRRSEKALPGSDRSGTTSPTVARDLVYAGLLETFAKRLGREKTALIMISVDGQLDRHPEIRATVDRLAASGLLTYAEVRDWLRGLEPYASPEGHLWGERAHAAIGRSLTDHVEREILAFGPGAAGAD